MAQLTEGVEFVRSLPEYDPKDLKWKDMNKENLVISLNRSKEVLEGIEEKEFALENLQNLLMEAAGTDRGALLWPLRLALTGQQKSPSPFECAWMLGREESIRRLVLAIKKVR